MDSGFSILSVAPRVAPRTVVQFLTLELDLNSGGENMPAEPGVTGYSKVARCYRH